ncbi:hypothetical protein ON010_g509 [Phytophthora cinnamomi]|nr:hypothetical protein ON010_g509 [Phytophthora cinnamomi]
MDLTDDAATPLVGMRSHCDVTEVPFQTLRDRGFRGVIFDKDNTLTVPHKLEIAPHLESSLAECRRVFGDSGVVIFSNSAGSTDDKDGVEAKKIEEGLNVAVLAPQPEVVLDAPVASVVQRHEVMTNALALCCLGLLAIRTEQFTPESESVVNRQLQRIEKAAVRMLVRAGVKPPTQPLWDNFDGKE